VLYYIPSCTDDIWTLVITHPIYLQPEDFASVWTVLMLIAKSKMLRAYQLQTWQFSAPAQTPQVNNFSMDERKGIGEWVSLPQQWHIALYQGSFVIPLIVQCQKKYLACGVAVEYGHYFLHLRTICVITV
jgi:hypothetical protein